MGTNAQLITFKDEDNITRRIAIREQVYNFFQKHDKPYTVREVSHHLGLEYRQCQPRQSELLSSGLIKVSGEKTEGTQVNSTFVLNPTPKLFGYGSKSKLELYRQAVKSSLNESEVEAIEDEFKRLSKLNS